MSRPAREPGERLAVLLLGALAAVLLFADLGDPHLWQDEAQTALLSGSVLHHGIPLGVDAGNSASQELGAEFGPDGIWKWHTWLPFYLVAASFALLGADTLSARLPFAVCGVLTVILTLHTGRLLWRDRRAAFAGALLLTLSVPFLVLSRQARYYALASLLSLLGLFAYSRLGPRRRGAAWLLFASASLLFHTQPIYAASLLASLLLHAAAFERQRLRVTLGVAAGTAALALPWILWASTLPIGPERAARFLDLSDTGRHAWGYAAMLVDAVFARGVLLAVPLLLLARRLWRGEPPWAIAPATRSPVALLLLFCGATLLALSLLSPLHFLRYLAPLLPPLMLLAGFWLAELSRAGPALAAGLLLAFALLGRLPDFLYEITHPTTGPVGAIVEFLRAHARPGDRVAIVYGDLPVKFYTGLRVVGGLTGEDLEAVDGADWIIPRRHLTAPVSRRVRQRLLAALAAGNYRPHELPVPDLAFENREDPRWRRFREPRPGPPVVVWERVR